LLGIDLTPELPLQKGHSTRKRHFSPGKQTYIQGEKNHENATFRAYICVELKFGHFGK